MSGFDFAELDDSWGPWYGAPFEQLDARCAQLRDRTVRALKLWSDLSDKYSVQHTPTSERAKDRALRILWSCVSQWAARRRQVAKLHRLPMAA